MLIYFILLTYFFFYLYRGSFFLFPILHMVESPSSIRYEEMYFENEMGAWVYPPRSAEGEEKVLIYFNGNAGNVSTRISNIRVLQHLLPEYRIYNLEYPGFGISAHLPLHLETIAEESLLVCEKILEKHPTLHTLGLWGESLGALVMTHVFSSLSNHVRWVMHMNGIASLQDTIAVYVPTLLQGLVLPLLPTTPRDALSNYQSIQSMVNSHQKIFIAHAQQDEVVSVSQSQYLYLALKTMFPESVVYIEWKGKHNGVLLHKENQDAIARVLETLSFD